MIQELLGSGLISGERRINPITNNGTTILQAATPHPTYSHHHHSSPSSSPSATTTAAAPSAVSTTPVGVIPTAAGSNQSFTTSSTPSSSSSAAGAAGEHLRCPRCDSSNTKFCYYNNYNLTQPRHFCKTCRRYWTKGGALRNVPIGGGCRKNKSTSGLITSSSATFGKPAATITGSSSSTNTTNKLKSLAHVEFGTSSSSSSSSSPSVFGASLYDLHLHPHHHQELPSSPILWASTPQTNSHHHFLSLLRSSSTIPPNPNPNPRSTATLPPTSALLKDEANGNGNLFETSTATTTSHLKMFEPAMTGRNLGGWDTSSVSNNQQQQQAPLLGLNYSAIPIWKGGSNGNGYLVGSDEPHHNTGMQEVYQRLKASTSSSSYDVFNDNNNMGSTSSSCFLSGAASSTVAGAGGFSGYSWSPAPAPFTSPTATATTTASPWSDLPTNANNGTAYP